jgi:hypothetical protein
VVAFACDIPPEGGAVTVKGQQAADRKQVKRKSQYGYCGYFLRPQGGRRAQAVPSGRVTGEAARSPAVMTPPQRSCQIVPAGLHGHAHARSPTAPWTRHHHDQHKRPFGRDTFGRFFQADHVARVGTCGPRTRGSVVRVVVVPTRRKHHSAAAGAPVSDPRVPPANPRCEDNGSPCRNTESPPPRLDGLPSNFLAEDRIPTSPTSLAS